MTTSLSKQIWYWVNTLEKFLPQIKNKINRCTKKKKKKKELVYDIKQSESARCTHITPHSKASLSPPHPIAQCLTEH